MPVKKVEDDVRIYTDDRRVELELEMGRIQLLRYDRYSAWTTHLGQPGYMDEGHYYFVVRRRRRSNECISSGSNSGVVSGSSSSSSSGGGAD